MPITPVTARETSTPSRAVVGDGDGRPDVGGRDRCAGRRDAQRIVQVTVPRSAAPSWTCSDSVIEPPQVAVGSTRNVKLCVALPPIGMAP